MTALFSPATSRSAIPSSPSRVASAASVPRPGGAEERHPGEVGDDRLDRGAVGRTPAGRVQGGDHRVDELGRGVQVDLAADGQDDRRPDARGVGRHEGGVGHGLHPNGPVTGASASGRPAAGRPRRGRPVGLRARRAPRRVRPPRRRPSVRTSSPAWGRPTSEISLSSSIGSSSVRPSSVGSLMSPSTRGARGHPSANAGTHCSTIPRTATVQSSWASTFIQPVSTRRNTRWSAGRVSARPVSR